MQSASLAIALCLSFILTSGCGWFSDKDDGNKSTSPDNNTVADPSTKPDPEPTTIVKTERTNVTVGYSFGALTDGKVSLSLTLKKNKAIAPDVPYEVLATCSHWDSTKAAVSGAKGTSDADGKVNVDLDALFGVCTYELKVDGEIVGDIQLTYGMQLGVKHVWTATDQVPSGTGCANIKAFHVNNGLRDLSRDGTPHGGIVVSESGFSTGDAIYFINIADYVDGACVFGTTPIAGNALRKDLDATLAPPQDPGYISERSYLADGKWQHRYTLNGKNATAAISRSYDKATDTHSITYHIPAPVP